jgi:GNAT superfamily N-acetyltransferase
MSQLTANIHPAPLGLVIRPVAIDELSEVRHLHTSACRLLSRGRLGTDEMRAAIATLDSAAYLDHLIGRRLLGGFIGSMLVATIAWSPDEDNPGTARLEALFVRPLMTGIGLGRRLLEAAEQEARAAGCSDYAYEAPQMLLPFLRLCGYDIRLHGLRELTPGVELPITLLAKCGPLGDLRAIAVGAQESEHRDDAHEDAVLRRTLDYVC